MCVCDVGVVVFTALTLCDDDDSDAADDDDDDDEGDVLSGGNAD